MDIFLKIIIKWEWDLHFKLLNLSMLEIAFVPQEQHLLFLPINSANRTSQEEKLIFVTLKYFLAYI
jgi:hypothetical protein